MKDKKIVFLGDSITQCFDLEKYFSNFKIKNEGISGHTTKDVLKRLKTSVFDHAPDIVVLLIGTNDLELLNSKPEEVVEGIKEIIKRILEFDNNIKIFLQSIYPVNQPIKPFSVGRRTNSDILKINAQIKNIKEVTYLNMYDLLINAEGKLNKEYTSDGIHINELGYQFISEQLKSFLK